MRYAQRVALGSRTSSRSRHRIWLRYSDGVSGKIDLSDLTEKGVFKAWDKDGVLDRVHIAAHGAIAWNSDIELCPDALCIELIGKSPRQVLPGFGDA